MGQVRGGPGPTRRRPDEFTGYRVDVDTDPDTPPRLGDLIRKSSRGRASGTTGLAWLRRGAGAGEAVVRRRARG